jgi:hypothetical protein
MKNIQVFLKKVTSIGGQRPLVWKKEGIALLFSYRKRKLTSIKKESII